VLEELHFVSVLKDFLRGKLMIHSTFLCLVELLDCDVVRIFFSERGFLIWFRVYLYQCWSYLVLLWKKYMRLLVGFYFWSLSAFWFWVFVMCY